MNTQHATLGITLSERLMNLGFIDITGLPCGTEKIDDFYHFQEKGAWSVHRDDRATFFYTRLANGKIYILLVPSDDLEKPNIVRETLESIKKFRRVAEAVADHAYEICYTESGKRILGVVWSISQEFLDARAKNPKWMPQQ